MAKMSDSKKKIPIVPHTGMFYLHDDRLQKTNSKQTKKSQGKMKYRKKGEERDDDEVWSRDKFLELESEDTPILNDTSPSFYRRQRKNKSSSRRKRGSSGKYKHNLDSSETNNNIKSKIDNNITSTTEECIAKINDKNNVESENVQEQNENNDETMNKEVSDQQVTNDQRIMSESTIKRNNKYYDKDSKKDQKVQKRRGKNNRVTEYRVVDNNNPKNSRMSKNIEKKDDKRNHKEDKRNQKDYKRNQKNESIIDVDEGKGKASVSMRNMKKTKKHETKDKFNGKMNSNNLNSKTVSSFKQGDNKHKRKEFTYQKKVVTTNGKVMENASNSPKATLSQDANLQNVNVMKNMIDVNETLVKDEMSERENKLVSNIQTDSGDNSHNSHKNRQLNNMHSKRNKGKTVYTEKTKPHENGTVVDAPSTIIPNNGEAIISSKKIINASSFNARTIQSTTGHRGRGNIGRGGRGSFRRGNGRNMLIRGVQSDNDNNYSQNNNSNQNQNPWARMNPNAKEFVSEMNSNTPQLMVFDHFGNAVPVAYMQDSNVEFMYPEATAPYSPYMMGPPMMYPSSPSPLDANVYGYQTSPSPPPTTTTTTQQQQQQQQQQLQQTVPKVLQEAPTNINQKPLRFSEISDI